MKIQLQQFGELEFNETDIIKFKDGIIGFEKLKGFIFWKREEDILYWLISVEEPELIFPVFPISLLQSHFPQKDGHEAYGIIRMAKNPVDITINLKAPLFIDHESKIGYQEILDRDTFPIDYKLFVEGD